MAQVTVGPKWGGSWHLYGAGEPHEVRTLQEGIAARQAPDKGRGEFVVRGGIVWVRMQNSSGRRDARDG
jgi:hypothetical protein